MRGEEEERGGDADDASVSLWIPVLEAIAASPIRMRTPNIFILFYSFLRPHFVMEGRGGESRKGKGMTPVVLLPLLPWGTLLTWARFLNSAGDWGRAPFFLLFSDSGEQKSRGSVCFASKLKGGFSHGGNHALIIALTQGTLGTLFSCVYPGQKQQRNDWKKKK